MHYLINYLTDEAVDMGKGSNAIVSMLHHYFSHHGLGKKHTCTLIIVVAKIRTPPWFITSSGM